MSMPQAAGPALAARPVTVLLIDDQAIVGESVRRMLAGETDIVFHFCKDPTKAYRDGRCRAADSHLARPGHAGD